MTELQVCMEFMISVSGAERQQGGVLLYGRGFYSAFPSAYAATDMFAQTQLTPTHSIPHISWFSLHST